MPELQLYKLNLKPFFRDLIRGYSLVWNADKNISILNIIIQGVQALLPILSLYYMKLMIEAVVHSHKTLDQVLQIIIIYGVIQLVSSAVGQYAGFIATRHQFRLTDNLSREVLQKAVEVEYAYYENPAYHDTLHLAQQQAIFKATQLLTNFNALLLNILSLIFLVGFFVTLHSAFAAFFIVLSLPLAIIKWYSGFKLLQLDKKFAPLEREATYLHQTLTGINPAKEVRVFGFGEFFIEKFRTIRELIQIEKTRLNARLTWYSLFAEAAEIVVMMIVFGVLAKYTWEKAITIGAFVIYLQGFQRLQSSSKSFLQAMVQLFQQRLFLKDLFYFLDMETGLTSAGHKPFPAVAEGLAMHNLSFTYPGTNRQVLKNINMNCKPGSIIAIVGENGSGKSTLVKLLARLYQTQTPITIDGEEITDIRIEEFRNKTVFLFQDFEKYYLTIKENITLGDFRPEVTDSEIEQAAKLADAHGFISRLTDGYQTRIGRVFRGSEQLSGGQWQKLALSRAFYRRAKLIILDEPTSSLDPIAEFEVFENLKDQISDQMVVLITHRLYNLKMADHIYVLKNGCIDQHGTFEELSTRDGEFKKMYDNQKLS